METGILLESGTNELEILEFRVGENYYGINVAKIREILPYQKPTPIRTQMQGSRESLCREMRSFLLWIFLP